MTAENIVEFVARAGGQLWIDGGKLKYRIPAERDDLIAALRELKADILRFLSERPAMPQGVRLVRWEPKQPPVSLPWSTVTDVDLFLRTTLQQLDRRINGNGWMDGGWGLSGLLARLEACGCVVALDDPKAALQ